MGWLRARDYSQWQGDVDFTQEPVDVAIIKMSGGDNGLYMDSKASQNYERAVAAGKGVAGYHFAGGTDATTEADYFLRAMAPLAENDVYVLDFEVSVGDPVGWVTTFVNRVHDKIGVWPIVYMSGSRWNQYDWSGVTANCGVWVAWWGISPDAQVPVKYPYILHQYDNSGTVVSNGARVDEDAVFLTLDQWHAYGWHAPAPAVVPAPISSPAVPDVTPTTSEVPTVVLPPVSVPTLDKPVPVPSKPPVVNTPATGGVGFFQAVWAFIKSLLGIK